MDERIREAQRLWQESQALEHGIPYILMSGRNSDSNPDHAWDLAHINDRINTSQYPADPTLAAQFYAGIGVVDLVKKAEEELEVFGKQFGGEDIYTESSISQIRKRSENLQKILDERNNSEPEIPGYVGVSFEESITALQQQNPPAYQNALETVENRFRDEVRIDPLTLKALNDRFLRAHIDGYTRIAELFYRLGHDQDAQRVLKKRELFVEWGTELFTEFRNFVFQAYAGNIDTILAEDLVYPTELCEIAEILYKNKDPRYQEVVVKAFEVYEEQKEKYQDEERKAHDVGLLVKFILRDGAIERATHFVEYGLDEENALHYSDARRAVIKTMAMQGDIEGADRYNEELDFSGYSRIELLIFAVQGFNKITQESAGRVIDTLVRINNLLGENYLEHYFDAQEAFCGLVTAYNQLPEPRDEQMRKANQHIQDEFRKTYDLIIDHPQYDVLLAEEPSYKMRLERVMQLKEEFDESVQSFVENESGSNPVGLIHAGAIMHGIDQAMNYRNDSRDDASPHRPTHELHKVSALCNTVYSILGDPIAGRPYTMEIDDH